MKIKKLLEQLSTLDPNLDVLMAADLEGNSFELLRQVDSDNIGYTKSGYEYCICQRELTKKDTEAGYTEEDLGVDSKAKKCIVLWP